MAGCTDTTICEVFIQNKDTGDTLIAERLDIPGRFALVA
jgi:hypothetical protein